MRILTAAQVQQALTDPSRPLLIHVLPEEHYVARRIPGAVNLCAYDPSFVQKVKSLVGNLATPIIVYGEGKPSLDSDEAARQLSAAGFTNVSDFRGGLRAWSAGGYPIFGDGPVPAAAAANGSYQLDTQQSVIRWTGLNLLDHHSGYLKFSKGQLRFSEGELIDGMLTIDMNSIECADVEDAKMNAMMITQLRHRDMFNIDEHPTALLSIHHAEHREAGPDSPNAEVFSVLRLRGRENDIAFPAIISTANPEHVTAQGTIEFDRTKFGSTFHPGRLFAFLGKRVVNDMVRMHLKIHAVRSAD